MYSKLSSDDILYSLATLQDMVMSIEKETCLYGLGACTVCSL
jgi:hypothetical protein